MPDQGDIIEIKRDGCPEQEGIFALVISNREYQKHTGLVVVCPVARGQVPLFPLHVEIKSGSEIIGSVLCEQLRTLDLKVRKHRVAGHVSDDQMREVLEIISGELQPNGF